MGSSALQDATRNIIEWSKTNGKPSSRPKATEIFGSQEEAERWLDRPALALGGNRPINLLSTPAGIELVESHLERIEFGVYE